MQSNCIIKRSEAGQSIETFGAVGGYRSGSPGGPSHGHGAKAFREREPGRRGAAHDEHRVLASDRTNDLGPALGVYRLSDWLCSSRQGVQHEQLAHPVDVIEELG